MNDRPHRGRGGSGGGRAEVIRKKSYLTSRNRSSAGKVERADHVKDSLMKFLDDAQDEDLIFNACSPVKGTRNGRKSNTSSASEHGGGMLNSFSGSHGRGGNTSGFVGGLSSTSDHISKNIGNVPVSPLGNEQDTAEDLNQINNSRQIPFDRSVRRSKSRTNVKTRRSGSRRPNANKKFDHSDRVEDDDDDVCDDENSFADDGSFALEEEDQNDDYDDDITLSSEEKGLPKRRLTRNNSFSSAKSGRGGPRVPRRTQSYNDRHGGSGTRSRSSSRGRSGSVSSSFQQNRNTPRRTQSYNHPGRGQRDALSASSASIVYMERQARRDRMKRGYRTPSRDAWTIGQNIDTEDDDGNESVASNTSQFSTRSSMSTRRSGLEGGALNAFLGDEKAARNATKGLGIVPPSVTQGGVSSSVISEPADERFIQQRKQRQDFIMDVALKEKYANQARAREEESTEDSQRFDQQSDDDSSDDSLNFGKKKKKGMLGRMQRAAKKTAKVSKSGAKGTVNVVKDPRKAAMKVGVFAKSVGKETGKMVLDPTLAAKKGAKGIKGTVKMTTKVTKKVGKGSLGMTTSLAQAGFDVTTLVVGSTIDGTAKVVNGATGFIIKKKDEDGGDHYDDYDPRQIQGRHRSSVIGRFAAGERMPNDLRKEEDDGEVLRQSLERRSNGNSNPSVLVPSIEAGSKRGSWDV